MGKEITHESPNSRIIILWRKIPSSELSLLPHTEKGPGGSYMVKWKGCSSYLLGSEIPIFGIS